MNKEELFECLSGLSQTNNLRDGIDIRKEEANIIVNEIERLAKEVEKLEKVNKMLLNSMVTEAHTKETKEIERLNNIINELEEWLKKEIFDLNGDYDYEGVVSGYENALNKLLKLKHKKIYGSVDSKIVYFDELGWELSKE